MSPPPTTEQANPASARLDALDSTGLVELFLAEDASIVGAVATEAATIGRAIDLAHSALRDGGRIIYVGAGTSGRLGVLDASECPPTFGTPPELVIGVIAGGPDALTHAIEGAEDRSEDGADALDRLAVSRVDLVVGIATSGRTPFVLGAVGRAKSLGAATIGIACNKPSALGDLADVEIAPIVGPEVIAGSTRLKAGTATKMILNMISTGAMVLLGKTYGNLMVDLRPTNEKLRLRARRILRQVAGVGEDEAVALLAATGGRLKTALVAALAGVPPAEADRLLERSGGVVRAAAGEAGSP